jgi:hypothetical protein
MIVHVPKKSTSEASHYQNVVLQGTGALHIHNIRVGTSGGTQKIGPPSYKPGYSLKGSADGTFNGGGCGDIDAGRWPSNLLLLSSASIVLDEQSGVLKSGAHLLNGNLNQNGLGGSMFGGHRPFAHRAYHANEGGASRFFQIIEDIR